MFIDFFDWFCNALKDVYVTMDKFILFNNFSYFDFSVSILASYILVKLVKFIMGIEDEEVHYTHTTKEYINQYDSYIPKHARKKRG